MIDEPPDSFKSCSLPLSGGLSFIYLSFYSLPSEWFSNHQHQILIPATKRINTATKISCIITSLQKAYRNKHTLRNPSACYLSAEWPTPSVCLNMNHYVIGSQGKCSDALFSIWFVDKANDEFFRKVIGKMYGFGVSKMNSHHTGKCIKRKSRDICSHFPPWADATNNRLISSGLALSAKHFCCA